jgi:hypothetical protein
MVRLALAAVGFGLVSSACYVTDDPPTSESDQIILISETDYFWPPAPHPGARVRDATGADLAPVHATLLPDGTVHLIGVAGNAGIMTPDQPDADPDITLAPATPPVELPAPVPFGEYLVSDSLFCSGHTLLADGDLLTIGGTRGAMHVVPPPPPGEAPPVTILGTSYATRYDAATGTWHRVADPMKGVGGYGETWRWYGQATRLATGKVLVMGGRDFVGTIRPDGTFTGTPSENLTAEIFDPATETFAELTDGVTSPPEQIFNGDYSHPFVLPYPGIGVDVMTFGWASEPVFVSTDAAAWFVNPLPRPGAPTGGGHALTHPNDGASSVMLPIRLQNGEHGYFNGSVAIAGGEHGMPMEHHVDVYDPVAAEWTRHVDFEALRHHPSTVLLPDGKLLIVAGHDDVNPGNPEVGRAVYLDPRDDFSLRGGYANMGEVRGYHTISLLLPDGRVIVGGGRTGGPLAGDPEKPTLRYLYPPYMWRTRPGLAWAPPAIGYGAGFPIYATGAPVDAVLIGLGSMTHSFDSNQRAVQIAIAPRAGTPNVYDLVGPADTATAPPGHYMLFVLDAARTPSAAKIVQLL